MAVVSLPCRFNPPETFAPFQLAPGLIYNNAIENAASAMEVSAVAAMNSALLVAKHLSQPRQQQQQQLHGQCQIAASGGAAAEV